jgi:hypothetical protein
MGAMGDINFPAPAVQVDFLVRRRFGNAVQRGGRVPHYFPEANKRIGEAGKYQAELYAMRPEEVQALYKQEREKEREEHEKVRMEWQAKADREEAQGSSISRGSKRTSSTGASLRTGHLMKRLRCRSEKHRTSSTGRK